VPVQSLVSFCASGLAQQDDSDDAQQSASSC